MNAEIIAIILAMALVTFIPRVVPALFADKIKVGPKFEKYLRLIPYTAMTALVFPGIFAVDPAHPEIGILAGLAAFVLSWRKVPLIIGVVAAIAVAFILYLTL